MLLCLLYALPDIVLSPWMLSNTALPPVCIAWYCFASMNGLILCCLHECCLILFYLLYVLLDAGVLSSFSFISKIWPISYLVLPIVPFILWLVRFVLMAKTFRTDFSWALEGKFPYSLRERNISIFFTPLFVLFHLYAFLPCFNL